MMGQLEETEVDHRSVKTSQPIKHRSRGTVLTPSQNINLNNMFHARVTQRGVGGAKQSIMQAGG